MNKNPFEAAIRKALKFPNGWVYELNESFKGKLEVPPDTIKAAWKVDGNGIIIG